MTKGTDTIRVLVKPEGDRYVAQCLEVDIAVEGSNFPQLRDALRRALLSMMAACHENGIDFDGLPRAPQHYHDEYALAEGPEDQFQVGWKLLDAKPVRYPVNFANLKVA